MQHRLMEMLKTAIIFLGIFLPGIRGMAYLNNTDFQKYGFKYHEKIMIERALWGFKLSYTGKSLNSYAYVLQKVPQPDTRFKDNNEIVFSFKARLYPVAPETKSLRHIIKSHIRKSMGVTKVKKAKEGVICAPAFVVSMNNCLTENKSKRELSYRAFPLQYRKTSKEFDSDAVKPVDVTLLFRDARPLPLNLFSPYDIKIIFDYENKIVSFNCNGNKVILRDNSLEVWQYFGLATLFSAIGVNRTMIVALEYEFTNIKTSMNENRTGGMKKQTALPRYDNPYYERQIDLYNDVDAMYCLGMNYYEGFGRIDKDYYQAFKWFKKAALKDHVFAQYYLGLCYLYGRGTKPDNSQAWRWILRASDYYYDKAQVLAAQCVIDKVKASNELERARLLQSFLGPAFFQGNANACFLQSYCAHYDTARRGIEYLEGFKDAARRGHPKAFYYLGLHFSKEPKTCKVAFKCFLNATDLGFAPAWAKLGECYLLGYGTEKNYEEALKCFEKSADSDDAEGMFKLGCCYVNGKGAKADRSRALELFTRSMRHGSPRALVALLLLRENSVNAFFNGDDNAGNENFSDKKDSTYEKRRAICLKYGIGATKSLKNALPLLKKHADDPWMAFEFADCLTESKGRSRDFYSALALYKQAADAGSVRALWRLGGLYMKLGEIDNAMRFYREAADKGHGEAAFKFAELLLKNGDGGINARQRKAFAYFNKAAENGWVKALLQVGDCYYNGLGVAKNPKLAAEYWRKYETAFEEEQDNSIHGLYWKPLPYQRPLEFDKNGLPLKFHSQLKDKSRILSFYQKY